MDKTDKVADVLEVETKSTIADWLRRADSEPDIMGIQMTPRTDPLTCQRCSGIWWSVFETRFH